MREALCLCYREVLDRPLPTDDRSLNPLRLFHRSDPPGRRPSAGPRPDGARTPVARCEHGVVEYDPTQYVGAAPYYLRGRPPYSADLPSVLANELGLDGTGHLVDVGCGPGTVGVQLGGLFERVTLVDPDPHMLPKPARTRQGPAWPAPSSFKPLPSSCPNSG